jgi:phenylalanine-4-hydroxylase
VLTEPATSGDHTGRTLDEALRQPAESLPDSLEPFVVDQVPARYTAMDQAVWRFVLLQLLDRLKHTAHPSYVRGLAESGISPDHIPSISEMNRCLARVGWGAVCVDGFIPPRAFQGFQARGILPIAAEIRSVEQLPYTPAPDIIHEAAGHAPILIDPEYAAYVRAIGEIGSRAFSSPEDARIDRAVRRLSELKESPAPDPDELAAAERELVLAYTSASEPSEAARITRLYWWTAEYGLVGTPRDYRLYGAGLLSSLGESHFCHAPEVSKIVLSPACTDVSYDITRQQPQLFVARDFAHLHEVLAAVSRTLAHEVGGDHALALAAASQEPCTLSLEGGLELCGVVQRVEGSARSGLIELAAGCALVRGGRLLGAHAERLLVPLGVLADGRSPQSSSLTELRREADAQGRVRVAYRSGVVVSGEPCGAPWPGSPAILWLGNVRLEWRGQIWLEAREPYPLVLTSALVTAAAGYSSDAFGARALGPAPRSAGQPRLSVPKPKQLDAKTAQLERLYRAVAELPGAAPGSSRDARVAAVHAALCAHHPHDWLLRWNLLERTLEVGKDPQLAALLAGELLTLEAHHGGRYPIVMGLDYLRARSADTETIG